MATEDGDPIVPEAVDRSLHGHAGSRHAVAVQHGRTDPTHAVVALLEVDGVARARVASRSVMSAVAVSVWGVNRSSGSSSATACAGSAGPKASSALPMAEAWSGTRAPCGRSKRNG